MREWRKNRQTRLRAAGDEGSCDTEFMEVALTVQADDDNVECWEIFEKGCAYFYDHR